MLTKSFHSDLAIVVAADAAVVDGLVVTLTSARLSTKASKKIHAIILSCGLGKNVQQEISSHLNLLRNFSFEFTPVNHQTAPGFEQLPANMHISQTSWARLWAPLLKPEFSWLIYLDIDTLVNIDLSKLPSLANRDYVVMAVRETDMTTLCERLGNKATHDLGLHQHLPAFNAGVLLINTALWRSTQVVEKCLSIASRYDTNQLKYVDQDALNIVLSGQWGELESEWNWRNYLNRNKPTYPPLRPCIIHTSGDSKPWHFPRSCKGGILDLYDEILEAANLKRSPYSQYCYADWKNDNIAKWLATRIFQLKHEKSRILALLRVKIRRKIAAGILTRFIP